MHYDYDRAKYILDIPTYCPNCDERLELDVNFDPYTVFLLCENPNCDYELDVTDEFKKLDKLEKSNELEEE